MVRFFFFLRADLFAAVNFSNFFEVFWVFEFLGFETNYGRWSDSFSFCAQIYQIFLRFFFEVLQQIRGICTDSFRSDLVTAANFSDFFEVFF